MKLKSIIALVFGMLLVTASAVEVQAQCDFVTEIRSGVTWHVLQSDCDGMNIPLPENVDLNQYALNISQPTNGRVYGAIAVTTPASKNLINGSITTSELDGNGICASGDNRLTGLLIRNTPNFKMKGVRIYNINFGPNVPCSEGIGIRIDNNTLIRSQISMDNVRIDTYQRAGLLAQGSATIHFSQSEIGKCTNEDALNCYNGQFSGDVAFHGKNSRFALNSNRSPVPIASITLDFRTLNASERSSLINCQFRDGNTETVINVFRDAISPSLDNCKIAETGSDSSIPIDFAVRDQGIGMTVTNMDEEAKVRGFDVPFYHLYPVIHTVASFMIQPSSAGDSYYESSVH